MPDQLRVAVVDGYSSGRFLVEELLARGTECVHVASDPEPNSYYRRSFQPADYHLDLGYHAEPAKVARRLAELGVAYVVAGTESGVALTDTLGELLALPHNEPASSLARRNKYAMASLLAEAGVDAPRSALVGSAHEAREWFAASGLPVVVVKPVASAATDHVRVCQSAVEVARACGLILGSANVFGKPNHQALIQEYLSGPEYYVNTVSVDGTHVIAETWQYTKTRTPQGAPIFDYEEPADLAAPETQAVHDYLRRALTALGVRTAAAHSEIVLTARGPVLIDPGARLGGGIQPWVAAKYLGYSHAGLLAESIVNPAAVAGRHELLPARWDSPIRYVSLINLRAGQARSLDWVRQLKTLPTLIELTSGVLLGDPLPPTVDLLSSPGYVYLVGAPEQIKADHRTIRAWEQEDLYLG